MYLVPLVAPGTVDGQAWGMPGPIPVSSLYWFPQRIPEPTMPGQAKETLALSGFEWGDRRFAVAVVVVAVGEVDCQWSRPRDGKYFVG